MSYVVVAEFTAKPEAIEAFAAFMMRHAALSRAEPGCRAFEVCQDRTDPAHFLFYEVFDDEAAYAAHRAMPHYQRWRQEGPEMLTPHGSELFLRRSVLRQVAP